MQETSAERLRINLGKRRWNNLSDNKRYPEEFKIEAVRQIVDRGYSVAGVASRLGVRNTACMPGYAVTDPIRTRQQRRMKRRKRFAVFRPS